MIPELTEEGERFKKIIEGLQCTDDVTALIMMLCFILAYTFGSIPFGLILTKIFCKQDIRKIGSGNTGATNVLRTGNKKLAALTLLLDAGKGAAAIGTFYLLYISQGLELCLENTDFTGFYLFLGLIAIIGHCFPIWLLFKGGKGVATGLGALLAATPLTGLAACATWLASAFLFKYSSLAALIAFGIAPIFTYIIYGKTAGQISIVITAIVWLKHKKNVERLLAGTEPKIGAQKEEEQDNPQS